MILHTDKISKIYKKRTVVNEVSISISEGEIVGLLGPNGAGKSTAFHIIVGLIQPKSGKVFLSNQDITKKEMYQRANLGIGYLPQEVSIFRKLTVEENILAPLQFTTLSKKEQQDKTNQLMEEFKISHLRKAVGYSLSGGEKRRTEIARALTMSPKFLLLDEPFAGIDPIAIEDIQRIITQLKNRNIGVLITDHNVHETLSITDRSYLIYDGKILKEGTAEMLSQDEEVRRLYLGEQFSLSRYQK